MEKDTRIPVTIITGFLGAGKTTLLNHFIKDHPAKKFAIIENEFGEIGIDGGLIVGSDENIFELSNGCICCTLHESFYETIIELLKSPYPFNHLLIETTGVADPDSIIQAFLSSPSIQKNFRLDSVVCIADCGHVEDLIDERPEVIKQLALADVVVLNKVDTVRKGYLTELTELIKEINPMALVYPARFSRIEKGSLLHLKAFSAENIEKTTLSLNTSKAFQFITEKEHDHHHHKNAIKSFGFVIPGNFDDEKFNIWIRNLLFFKRNTVYRIKGIVSFNGRPEKHILQVVRDSCMLEPSSKWENENRFSKLVFIGKKLNHDKLEDGLYQLLANPAELLTTA